MELETLRDLFIDELKDLYNAENQLVKALPKIIKAATDEGLKQGLSDHFEQTRNHVARIEQIMEGLDESPGGKKCKAMEGLLKEGAELLEEEAEPEVMDAGIICACQKVEHYEIAGYGTVRTYAELLGEDEAARLLDQTLSEEKAADEKLSEAASTINVAANTGGGGEEGESEDADAEMPRRGTSMAGDTGRTKTTAGRKSASNEGNEDEEGEKASSGRKSGGRQRSR
jgi:ferritin-like metal-binding protein YciE